MLKEFGPRGWWPITPPGGKSPVYRPGVWNRLSDHQRFEICVGAILTQNTAWSNVVKALSALQAVSPLSLEFLCSVPESRLSVLIRPSGYFRQKAKKLKIFVKAVKKHGGLKAWLTNPGPKVRAELLGLWGIGPETADSILLYAAAKPAFVVDAYTLRIGSRLGWFKPGTGYEAAQNFLTAALPKSARLYGEFHALVVELAKRFCRVKPSCPPCPLRRGCRTARELLAAVFLAGLPVFSHAGDLRAAAGKVDITPDLAVEKTYMAGFGSRGRKPAGVHDPLYARILLLTDGKKTIGVVGLDLLGFYRKDVEDLRRLAGFEGPDRYLFIAATHQHSGPDTLGLWGPAPGISGANPAYHARIKGAVAAALRRLEAELKAAELSGAAGAVDPRGLCRDTRDPAVIDPNLSVLSVRDAKGAAIATVVNWSCHPEVLGRGNSLITADYPGPLCSRIEEVRGGTCLFLTGAIGGLMTPDSKAENFYEAHRIGTRLADLALALRPAPAKSIAARLDFFRETVLVPVENSRYLLFLKALTFGHDLKDSLGRPLPSSRAFWLTAKHAASGLEESDRPWVETEVSRLDLGPVRVLGIPAEIFPELVIGGYDGRFRAGWPLLSEKNPDPPELSKAPKPPYLRDLLGAGPGMVVGLANDELGYLVPAYDFKTRPGLTMLPRLPGHHYEETNSIGLSATGIVTEAARRLLKQ